MLANRIIYIVALSTLLCLVTATVWRYGFKQYYQYSFKKIDHIFSDTSRVDILLLGNSFTYYGIDPRPIDSATGKKCYNIAMGGAEIAEMKFLFQS